MKFVKSIFTVCSYRVYLHFDHHLTTTVQSPLKMPEKPVVIRLNSDKVLFSFARGRERCDRNGHAVFLRPGVDFATTGSEITGISTSSTKLK